MEKTKNKDKLSFMPILKGTAIGVIITFLASAIFSVILLLGNFPSSVNLIMAVAALSIGVYLAGYISARSNGEKGMLYGVAAGGLQFLLFVILSVCLDRDGFGTLFFIKLALVLVLSALGGVVGVNSATKRKII